MKDPERYLDGDRSRLGARLLASAESDGPETRSIQRALAAAAAIASATAATGTATATATAGVGAGVWIKWLAIGALAGGVTATAASELVDEAAPPSGPTAVAITASVSPPLAPSVHEPAPPQLRAEPTPSAPPRTTAPPTVSTEPQEVLFDTLGPEVRRIDQARRRQASGDARGALVELDAYQREFPRGRFAAEAALIRAEMLAALGDCNGALRLVPAGDGGVLGRRWKALRDRCR